MEDSFTEIYLIAKTQKGKNKIREAGTDNWKIILGPKEVHFAKGLWVYIQPNNDSVNKCRWIRFDIPDEDFIW